ncbi:MAG: putative ABC transporter permease [Collinsella sp.]
MGVLLEKQTGARFWDYALPFNLHGRICLYWACAFGWVRCVFAVSGAGIAGVAGICRLLVRLPLYRRGRDDGRRVVLVGELARLSDQLDASVPTLADRINESLADASDSMLERIPDSAIDSVAQTHIRGRAINAWLAELGDATLDALREKASMPTFIADGARGLSLAARRVADAAPSMPRPSLTRRRVGKRMGRPVPSVSLSRRDLRFFNAFPRLRINRYEGVIRATDLRDRARELFRR